MFKLISLIKDYLGAGQERSQKAKKNIFSSLLLKAVGIAISLLLVPLTIQYVDTSRYGIWLTISSIVAWLSFFDIGLTHGLRNKFAEAKAAGDHDSAQIYVSTTYAILAIVFIALWLIFIVVNQFLDWSAILKVSQDYSSDISVLVVIVFTYFCLQFVLKVITTVVTADQEPAKAALIEVIGQAISLIVIAILVTTTEGSLIYLGLGLCIAPVVVLLAANFFLFQGKLKAYRPSLSKVRFTHAKSLFNLGMVFFIIQIAGIVQFESANIIISRNFGPEDVTSYNIVYKYFGMLSVIFAIFLSPFWSASTEAFQKNDITWIRNGMKKYNILNIIFVLGGILMLFLADTIYDLWLGKDTVEISFALSFWGLVFFCLNIFAGKYVAFLNGISALRLQFWSSLVSPILYIGAAMVLINNFKMGVYALFIASVLANFNGFLIAPLQYYMVVVKKKKGIWIK